MHKLQKDFEMRKLSVDIVNDNANTLVDWRAALVSFLYAMVLALLYIGDAIVYLKDER